MKRKSFFVLFALAAISLLCSLFVSCSSDDDDGGNGGGATYAFQGKTYSGYSSEDGTITFSFAATGNSVTGNSNNGSDFVMLSGTYTVNGNIVTVTWANGVTKAFEYYSSEDCFYWGSIQLGRK